MEKIRKNLSTKLIRMSGIGIYLIITAFFASCLAERASMLSHKMNVISNNFIIDSPSIYN